ncbi:hypothetical protein EDD15DRAFT_2195625 [Pisolithus albus]|nr:hypothetical protein EDD15DRAFT_2195625 [Pisolithus albus]
MHITHIPGGIGVGHNQYTSREKPNTDGRSAGHHLASPQPTPFQTPKFANEMLCDAHMRQRRNGVWSPCREPVPPSNDDVLENGTTAFLTYLDDADLSGSRITQTNLFEYRPSTVLGTFCRPKVPVGLSLGIHSDTDADAFALLPDRGTLSCATYGVPGVNVGSQGGICGGASNERRCKCGGGVSYSDRAEGADPDCWYNDEPGQNPGREDLFFADYCRCVKNENRVSGPGRQTTSAALVIKRVKGGGVPIPEHWFDSSIPYSGAELASQVVSCHQSMFRPSWMYDEGHHPVDRLTRDPITSELPTIGLGVDVELMLTLGNTRTGGTGNGMVDTQVGIIIITCATHLRTVPKPNGQRMNQKRKIDIATLNKLCDILLMTLACVTFIWHLGLGSVVIIAVSRSAISGCAAVVQRAPKERVSPPPQDPTQLKPMMVDSPRHRRGYYGSRKPVDQSMKEHTCSPISDQIPIGYGIALLQRQMADLSRGHSKVARRLECRARIILDRNTHHDPRVGETCGGPEGQRGLGSDTGRPGSDELFQKSKARGENEDYHDMTGFWSLSSPYPSSEDPAGVYATDDEPRSLTSLQPWGFQFRRLLGGSHIPYPSSKQQSVCTPSHTTNSSLFSHKSQQSASQTWILFDPSKRGPSKVAPSFSGWELMEPDTRGDGSSEGSRKPLKDGGNCSIIPAMYRLLWSNITGGTVVLDLSFLPRYSAAVSITPMLTRRNLEMPSSERTKDGDIMNPLLRIEVTDIPADEPELSHCWTDGFSGGRPCSIVDVLNSDTPSPMAVVMTLTAVDNRYAYDGTAPNILIINHRHFLTSLTVELLLGVTSMAISTEITDVPHMPRLPSISALGRTSIAGGEQTIIFPAIKDAYLLISTLETILDMSLNHTVKDVLVMVVAGLRRLDYHILDGVVLPGYRITDLQYRSHNLYGVSFTTNVMTARNNQRERIRLKSGKTSSARLPHASAPVTPGSLDGTDPTLFIRLACVIKGLLSRRRLMREISQAIVLTKEVTPPWIEAFHDPRRRSRVGETRKHVAVVYIHITLSINPICQEEFGAVPADMYSSIGRDARVVHMESSSFMIDATGQQCPTVSVRFPLGSTCVFGRRPYTRTDYSYSDVICIGEDASSHDELQLMVMVSGCIGPSQRTTLLCRASYHNDAISLKQALGSVSESETIVAVITWITYGGSATIYGVRLPDS